MNPIITSSLSFIFLSFYVSSAICVAVNRGYTELKISNKYLSPDGFTRSAVVVNGQHTGPLVKANKGETFHVNIVNTLTNTTMLRSTSVHWHGIFQHGTNWVDGAVGVNQCPISPGQSFKYSFNSQNQAGTYWYHSHFGTQYCDGLRGPLVIYDNRDPYRHLYDIDDGKYHIPSPSIKTIALSDATLINGKGRYPGGPAVELAIVNVIPGKRYRFRLVSISCQPNFVFSIDGHDLTIIEADGQLTQQHTVNKIQIFAGQRYSFILQANQPVGNYWIRALPDLGSNGLQDGFAGGVNSATLRYRGAPESDPVSVDNPTGALLDEGNLRPFSSAPAPGNPWAGGADYNFNFAVGFIPGLPATFTIDGNAFRAPSVPVLLQILSGTRNAQDLLPQGSVYPLARNKVVEITVPGGFVGGPHPFHLHGHAFSVVRSASNSSTFNYANPIQRDVVSPGPDGSSTTIRFTTDNPGPWFFHCHIDFHLEGGLALIFAEDIEDTQAANPVPDSWSDLCPLYDSLPAESTSVDLVTFEPTITVNPFTTPTSTIAPGPTNNVSPQLASTNPTTSAVYGSVPIFGTSLPTPSLSFSLPFNHHWNS